MVASTTFHSFYIRSITQVLVLPLGVRTNIIHPSSVRISPFCNTYYVSPTRFCHQPGFGGVDVPSVRYDSRSHFLKC